MCNLPEGKLIQSLKLSPQTHADQCKIPAVIHKYLRSKICPLYPPSFPSYCKVRLGQLFPVLFNFDYASGRDKATSNIQ